MSDQGHRCTDPTVGARGRLSEAAVRDVARKLVRRVANEIRVGAEALEGHVRWYHSFLSPAARWWRSCLVGGCLGWVGLVVGGGGLLFLCWAFSFSKPTLHFHYWKIFVLGV